MAFVTLPEAQAGEQVPTATYNNIINDINELITRVENLSDILGTYSAFSVLVADADGMVTGQVLTKGQIIVGRTGMSVQVLDPGGDGLELFSQDGTLVWAAGDVPQFTQTELFTGVDLA